MMRKKYSLRKRIVMAIRDIRELAKCAMNCPGCGSSNVTGGPGSWICHSCGSQGQS